MLKVTPAPLSISNWKSIRLTVIVPEPRKTPVLVITVVVEDEPRNVPLTFIVPNVLAIVIDAAKFFVPVPHVTVPPELFVRFAFRLQVHAVAPPRTPPLFTVTAPLKVQVDVFGVRVPVMLEVPVTVR